MWSSVSFWSSVSARWRSSWEISWSCSRRRMFSWQSRRMLRTAMRASSARLRTCLAMSRRRSSVSWGLARPVRPVARSRRKASSAFSMRSVASRRASSIMASPLSLGGGGCVLQYRLEVAHDGAVVLSGGGEFDAAMHTEVEDDDGEGVLHAEREGGGVHHLEASVEGVQVAEAQELPRRRVLRRIGLVDAVNVLLGHEEYVGVDLDGAKGGGCIGRHVGVAGARGEDDHATLLQVADGAAADVGLGDGGDGDRALGADRESVPLQRVLQGEGVDDSGQHAGVVGGGAVHAGGGGGDAAEDVPRADDDGDLDPHALDRLQLPGDGIEHGGVDAVGEVAHEGFAAELQENAFRGVFRHRS